MLAAGACWSLLLALLLVPLQVVRLVTVEARTDVKGCNRSSARRSLAVAPHRVCTIKRSLQLLRTLRARTHQLLHKHANRQTGSRSPTRKLDKRNRRNLPLFRTRYVHLPVDPGWVHGLGMPAALMQWRPCSAFNLNLRGWSLPRLMGPSRACAGVQVSPPLLWPSSLTQWPPAPSGRR